jgi:hypothetical protein
MPWTKLGLLWLLARVVGIDSLYSRKSCSYPLNANYGSISR